jgi:predicted RNA-binding Zn ribbon-like protein
MSMTASAAGTAPGRLELPALLVNTVALAGGPDRLADVEAASSWCREHGLPPLSNARELARLREFRAVLHDLLSANNGVGDPRAAWAAVRPFARGVSLGIVLDAVRGPVLEPGGAGVDRIVARMLAIVYDAVASATWSRLRACKKPDCRLAYYDHSKNGSRAWCSMAVCGNRAKAQRRRSRARVEVPS